MRCSLAPREKPFKVFDGGGLYVEVYPTGKKFWRLKYKVDGKDNRLSLGEYPHVSLKEARVKREEIKKRLQDGLSPTPEKDADKLGSVPTFQQVAEDWADRFLVQCAPATQKKKKIFLGKHIFPVIGGMPINEITPPIILNKLMRPIEARAHLETAHRVKMVCSQIFRFGIAIGAADRDPTQDLRGAVPPPKVKHRASIIDPQRIGLLLRDIDNYTGHVVTCHALKILPLVFVRPGELRHAEWSEIDIEAEQWRIPAEKMKMRTPHIVPLSRQALGLFQSLKKHTGQHRFAFPGQRSNDRPISDMTINAALRYLGYGTEEITGHGFRSMASTLLNEQGFNADWIEKQLAHTERDGVRAAYNYAQYLPERRQMMQSWADYLDSLKASG